ncbi:hypothetical protein BCEN4_10008 [Burkholderia cenocepacia]|nr:hypothetical protein BCEN4_10008 [Burkholderia cenocepacia]
MQQRYSRRPHVQSGRRHGDEAQGRRLRLVVVENSVVAVLQFPRGCIINRAHREIPLRQHIPGRPYHLEPNFVAVAKRAGCAAQFDFIFLATELFRSTVESLSIVFAPAI